jgi:hypothetical protein
MPTIESLLRLSQCILFSVVFTPSPPATTAVLGPYVSSLYSQLTLGPEAETIFHYCLMIKSSFKLV